MRRLCALAASAVLWVQPANAAEIVQFSNNNYDLPIEGGFDGFDFSLGTLTSVTLLISTTQNQIVGMPGLPPGSTGTVDWSITGPATFRLWVGGNPHVAQFLVPISGSGSSPFDDDHLSFEIQATGTGLFSIDPTLIPPDGSIDPNYELLVGFVWPGFGSPPTQPIITTLSHPAAQLGSSGTCFAGFGDMNCNHTTFALTYNYTPAGEIQAVPEPSTWAMMLLGFGFVGAAMRSRGRQRQRRHRHA